MTTTPKEKKIARSVVFTQDEDLKMLKLRALHEKQTGQAHSINDVIRQAIVAQAKANGIR